MHKVLGAVLWCLALASCGGNGSNTSTANQPEIDSCEIAQRWEIAVEMEAGAKDFSGDLNNYMGDTDKLDFVHTFENGKLLRSRFYHPNGRVIEEIPFECQSVHGRVMKYYPNGQLFRSLPYRYGRRHGLALQYDSTGHLVMRARFEHDSLVQADTVANNLP